MPFAPRSKGATSQQRHRTRAPHIQGEKGAERSTSSISLGRYGKNLLPATQSRESKKGNSVMGPKMGGIISATPQEKEELENRISQTTRRGGKRGNYQPLLKEREKVATFLHKGNQVLKERACFAKVGLHTKVQSEKEENIPL